VLRLDERALGAAKSTRFVVLPAAPESKETAEPPATPSVKAEPPVTPSVKAEPAAPAVPRQLSGRIVLRSIGPFGQKIVLTNTDTMTWSGCILVARGRDVFKLGGMAPGGTREIPLGEFKKGGREVPFVERDRLGLFCAEGQKEFPARL
jgi:serine/threonine-protein kinase